MIVVRIWEGLGNQLFQYAFARSLVYRGKKVCLDTGNNSTSALHIKRPYSLNKLDITIKQISDKEKEKIQYSLNENFQENQIFRHYSLWRYKVLKMNSPFVYDCKLYKLMNNCYVEGWFQNYNYFENIRHILLREIKPKQKIRISKKLRTIIESDNVVAVHIRRTDYIKCHNTLPMEYYQRAILYFMQKINNPLFLFFSDDIEWVRNYFGKKDTYMYICDFGRFEDFEEMFIMSRCKNMIIANSTFSWWAAWLNQKEEKKVVVPKLWSRGMSKEEYDNLIPREWIRM